MLPILCDENDWEVVCLSAIGCQSYKGNMVDLPKQYANALVSVLQKAWKK